MCDLLSRVCNVCYTHTHTYTHILCLKKENCFAKIYFRISVDIAHFYANAIVLLKDDAIISDVES